MKTDTYYSLVEIINKHNESETGKILQCMLALSFHHLLNCEAKYITINLVEGVDIVVDLDEFKYAIEVKTTSRDAIKIGEKDFGGLEKYKEKGYIPIICVLKIDLHSEWLLIDLDKLRRRRKSTWNNSDLYTDDRFKELSKNLNSTFEKLLLEYATQIIENGLTYLLKILRERGIKYSGK
ncbi:MAG: hypothetical protein N2746_05470 [Deltaproteobacteria bacterium]|nr:hypothetical protein [Deltaproteobacteria bacterium]